MISVGEISARLRDRTEQLTRELLPAAVKEGPYLKIGSIDGEAGRSMVIYLQGTRQGKWTDFAADAHGDMLDLIAAVHGFQQPVDAVQWAKQWLGIHDEWSPRDAVQPNAEERARRAALARERAEKQAADEAKDREAKIRGAKSLFLNGRPIDATPAEYYLAARHILPSPSASASGGVDLSGLSRRNSDAAGPSRWPNSLRYHAEVWNRDVRDKLPTMLGGIFLPTGAQVGVHRTYLQRDADGRWGKLANGNAKKILGPSWGGFIPINKGASGKSMAEMPEGEAVYMAEGIEDCLTIRMVRPQLRIIAGLSLGNMGAIILPERARRLVICADRDEDVREIDKLERVIAQHQARGVTVEVVMPPPGQKDLNDWLRASCLPSPGASASGGEQLRSLASGKSQ